MEPYPVDEVAVERVGETDDGERDWCWTTSTGRTGGLERAAAGSLERDIRAMEDEAGSGVSMCHGQGKTAVYLSEDGRYIVEREPGGALCRLPLDTLPGTIPWSSRCV